MKILFGVAIIGVGLYIVISNLLSKNKDGSASTSKSLHLANQIKEMGGGILLILLGLYFVIVNINP